MEQPRPLSLLGVGVAALRHPSGGLGLMVGQRQLLAVAAAAVAGAWLRLARPVQPRLAAQAVCLTGPKLAALAVHKALTQERQARQVLVVAAVAAQLYLLLA